MTAVRVSPEWLALREPADAAARSLDLVDELRRRLSAGRTVIHDLGCGTGSMGRWLAPRLIGPQHWILYDRDAELLDVAAADMPGATGDGASIDVEVRERDITRLGDDDLAGASLITASALLDMFTSAELDRFVAACAGASCPVLVTISVLGRVELTPSDPFDDVIQAAFNDHQRRGNGDRSLLGPDAVGLAAGAFARLGYDVRLRPSPWRLGPAQAELATEWFAGWIGAACEQQPDLVARIGDYAWRRRGQASAGRLNVAVHHHDLLALPQRSTAD